MVLLLLWAPVLLSLASSPFREAVEQGAAASLAYAVASPAHAMLAASAALAALATLMGGLWALRWLCRAADSASDSKI